MKIMAIYTHPADVITDCGGTLALHADRGDDVIALIVTHGGRKYPNKYEEEWRKKNPDPAIIQAGLAEFIDGKKQELIKASKIIGISKLITLDYDDDFMVPEPTVIDRIAHEIAYECPDIVIMDYPAGGAFYGSHELCSSMIFAAITRASEFNHNLDKIAPHYVKQIFYTKIPVTNRSIVGFGNMKSDMYVDTTSVIERKMRAMDEFESQGYNGDFAKKFIESHDGERGRAAGVNFAENFMRHFVETYDHLPLTEYAIKKDELMAHRNYSTVVAREIKLKNDK
ncbi:MAG: PIG-L deacetylase family protein [Candidatus Merdivicinus sp.]|jgi:LmbE family N-acetylglucosaminyl deacetylase